MPEEVFKVIDYIALFQIVVFVILLAKRRQIKFESRLFLIFFLLVIGICLLDRLQYFYRSFLHRHNFPHLFNTGDIFSLLYLPALYFYIKSITTPGFKIHKRYLWHLLPSLIVFINLFFNYYIKPADIKFSLLKENMAFHKNFIQLEVFNLFHLLQLGYLFAGFYLLRNYQKKVRDFFSSYNKMQIPAIYAILLLILIVRLTNMVAFKINHQLAINMDVFLTLYSTLIIIIGYLQPKIFLQQTDLQKLNSHKAIDPITISELNRLMEIDKLYLNPELTLNDLAEKLEISTRELSFILNSELKLNFFNFVNTFRINEAKHILSEKTNNKTILEILYEVGFNNKSAFNRVFKEFTGYTPTEFRNNCNLL
jgi:AraC-like DNA-binding protein